DELLRSAQVIGVVRLAVSGQRHQRGVVKIVIPQGVETKPALVHGAQAPNVLLFVLGYDDDRTPAGGRARASGEFGEHMRLRRIEDLLNGVETQTVEMKFID